MPRKNNQLRLPWKSKMFWFLLIIISAFILLFAILNMSVFSNNKISEPEWGVSFSEKAANNLGLDPRAVYSALISDLGVRKIRISVHWDLLEKEKGSYNLTKLDEEVKLAEQTGTKLILAIGRKTPRWPECHVPGWAVREPKDEQQKSIKTMLQVVVERYRNSPALYMWQVENEPFLTFFGECAWRDDKFFGEEVQWVKSLDPNHKILVTDTGELSLWFTAAKYGDVLGATMYRRVWSDIFHMYVGYPIGSGWYVRRANWVKKLFDKEVINAELQAEPWVRGSGENIEADGLKHTLTHEMFDDNLDFARKAGSREIYLWGAEWWYYRKFIKGDDWYWEKTRGLFGE